MYLRDFKGPVAFKGNVAQHRAYWKSILEYADYVDRTNIRSLETSFEINITSCSAKGHPDFEIKI